MTIIAYRDGIMAADSGSFGASSVTSHAVKIARGPDGTLYGAAGIAADCEAFLQWVRDGAKGDLPEIRRTRPDESDDAIHVLRVRPSRDPEKIGGYGIETWVGASYAAIGDGVAVALGAFHAGATAVQAIQAAIEHSLHARRPIRSISHRES